MIEPESRASQLNELFRQEMAKQARRLEIFERDFRRFLDGIAEFADTRCIFVLWSTGQYFLYIIHTGDALALEREIMKLRQQRFADLAFIVSVYMVPRRYFQQGEYPPELDAASCVFGECATT